MAGRVRLAEDVAVGQALTQAVRALTGQLFLSTHATVERMVPDTRLREQLLESLANDVRRGILETHDMATEHRKRWPRDDGPARAGHPAEEHCGDFIRPEVGRS